MIKGLRLILTLTTFATLSAAGSHSIVFNYTKALRALHHSAAAHCHPEVLEKWSCGTACQHEEGIRNVTVIANNVTKTYGFVGYSPETNEILVSFRGSVNFQNIVTDIDFIEERYEDVLDAKVHSGFYNTYRLV